MGLESEMKVIFIWSTEVIFLEYWPSCIAAAALLCAANEVPNLSVVNPEHAESWCSGLRKVSTRLWLRRACVFYNKKKIFTRMPISKECLYLQENIIGCYRLMQEIVLDSSQSKSPKILPQFRVTVRTRMRSSDLSSSYSSSSSSSSSSPNKRRKLNQSHWVDDDKGNTEEWGVKRKKKGGPTLSKTKKKKV